MNTIFIDLYNLDIDLQFSYTIYLKSKVLVLKTFSALLFKTEIRPGAVYRLKTENLNDDKIRT